MHAVANYLMRDLALTKEIGTEEKQGTANQCWLFLMFVNV